MTDPKPPAGERSPWRLVPTGSENRPRSGAVAGVKHRLDRWRGAWSRLSGRPKAAGEDPEQAIEAAELAGLVPAEGDDDESLVAMFEALLGAWPQQEVDGQANVALIAPPHSQMQRAARLWAGRRKLPCLDAPSLDELLKGQCATLPGTAQRSGPFVIPALEHWFFRDAMALQAFRRLFDDLLATRRRWVLVCDSWAWRFLSHVVPLDDLPTWTLQRMGGRDLARWLGRGQSFAADGRWTFQVDDDEAPLDDDTSDDDGEIGAGAKRYFRSLAVQSQGLPLVAAQGWRQSLAAGAARAGAQVEAAPVPLLVRRLERVGWPATVARLPRTEMFLLHALCIHGGLPPAAIAQVTGDEPTALAWALRSLSRAGLVETVGGRARVTAAGYVPVQALLQAEGYLTDEGDAP